MIERFLYPEDIEKTLQVPRSFVYEHCRKGAKDPLPAFRFGKHLRFKESEFLKWVERHRK